MMRDGESRPRLVNIFVACVVIQQAVGVKLDPDNPEKPMAAGGESGVRSKGQGMGMK